MTHVPASMLHEILLVDGEVSIIYGTTGMGKSTVAALAAHQKVTSTMKPVLFIDTETRGMIVQERWGKMASTVQGLLIVEIDHDRINRPEEERDAILRAVRALGSGACAIVIDVFGFKHGRPQNQSHKVTKLFQDLSSFARDLHVPILLVCHCNAKVSDCPRTPPQSDTIAAPADMVRLAKRVVAVWRPMPSDDGIKRLLVQEVKNTTGRERCTTVGISNAGYHLDLPPARPKRALHRLLDEIMCERKWYKTKEVVESVKRHGYSDITPILVVETVLKAPLHGLESEECFTWRSCDTVPEEITIQGEPRKRQGEEEEAAPPPYRVVVGMEL